MEKQIQQAINGISGSRTIIAIAHRLSTIRNADKIIVLDEGRAVGMGTHEELLENCSVYREIYESQN